MYFEQNISGPIFIADAPDVVISSANSDTIHVVITVDDSSWDMDLCPSVQEDSFKAVIKLKDVLSSVAGKPDFLGEASSVAPKISINADNGTEPAILMEFQAFYGNADGKIPSELKRHWLSWREQISVTMRDAREFLTFASGLKLLGWSSGTYSAKAKLFVHGSDPVETTIAEGTLEDDCKYFKLDYSSAKLCESAGVDITRLMAIDCYFVLDGKDSGGTNAHLASYPLRLIISGGNDSRLKEFIFCNSLGVEDRVISFGINARSVKGERRVFTSDGTSHELDNSGIESFHVRSGNISSARGAALWSDFLKASGRYLTSGGKVTEIIVEEWDTDITEGELGNVSFKYHLSKTDRGRWFEDSESLGNYDPLEKFGALSVAGPEVATPPSEDLFFLKTRLDEFPLVELGDDFLFLVQSKSSYSWNSASLKSLKDWLLENISVEALQLWCGPWDNYSEAVSKYALSAGAGKNLYDLIAILNRVCQNNFNSLTNKILAETSARKTADSNLQTGIDNVNSLIPSVASTTNQLADKEFVNSSIASSTATFRGTFETINDLPTSSVKKNDYAFVIAVSNGNPEYQRYKYNGEAWAFEYTLNNSSFTSKQWAAITSGITTDKVSSYDTHIFNKGNPHGVTKAQVGFGSVENVALSTWKGSTNITTLGVITTGTWQGTKIANAYLANSSITIGTTKFNLGDAKTAIEGLTSLLFSGASGALTYNKTDKYYSLADNLVVNGILASGTSGTGGADGYSQVEWADIQKMTGSVSGSLASAYAVKESYSALNTIVSKKADKIILDAVTKKVISLENKYTAVTTDIANHIGNTTVHITSAERTAWNNKQAAISDLATIRSNAATAYDWGDHSKAGYITGITKAMVETVLTGNITSHTHSYIPLADKGLSNGKVPYYVDFPNYNTLVSLGYNEASTATEDEYYFKGLCKWAIDNFSNQGYIILIGNAQPNSVGYCSIELYSNRPKDADTGLPQYCSGTFISTSFTTTNFGCRNFIWNWIGFFNGTATTSSKWVNARTITLTGSVTGSVSIDGSSNVSLDTTTNHTHTFASLTSKPTTLSGYGITDASRIFRYTIPASGNKGVRITFTAYEPVKITVSGSNQNAQLMLVGTGYGEGGFIRNNFTEVVPSDGSYTWCVSNDYAFSVEIFSNRLDRDFVTVESPSPVTFTAISALSTDAAYRHLLTTANYSKFALPLTGGTLYGLLTITANANYGLTVNSILANNQAVGINFQINGTIYGRVLVKNTKELLYNDMTKTYTVYHSGNSNNTDTVWSAKRLATTYNLICPYTWNQKGSLTGTLVLSLPYGFNSMMQCIELSVYDYSSINGRKGATKFFINGYNFHSSNSKWINPYAFSIGNKNVKVRLGYYNNKCCILIGETNTTWEHPGLSVDNVYGYYANHVGTYKDDDWSCVVLQDESQITHVETASDTPLYAPCYTRAGLPYVTDNDVAAKYLKLAGGTISGWLIINASTLPISELTTDGITSNNTWNSAQNVNLLLRSANNAMTISLGGQENERKGIIQVGHSAQSYAKVLGDLYLNKFGGNVYIGENIAYHAGNANKSDVNWSCSTMSSMAIGSPYSDVFDANNPDRWINSNYGSANKDYSNMPSGWKYGTVLTIGQQNYRGINGVLNAQFVWDVQSGEDANHPGRLWWRTKNANTGWKNWQELLHTGNYSSYALPRTGGTITGSIKLDGDYPSIVPFVRNFKSKSAGGWSRAIAEIRVDNKNAFRIAAYGSYTPNAENNKIQYAYLGFASYNGLNLRISETSLSWGDNVIYHAGNCNLPTIPWKCSSLTANGSVEAKANLYGQSLEFLNISSSANHGGFIDFHFNGSTADYTSRIIEDAAGQLTLRAKEIVVPGAVHATIGIYTDGYISAKQASTSSDRRLKKDFCKIDNALKYVLKTHYTRFRWKDDNKESIGIIAQEEQNREYGFLVQNNEKIGHLTYDYAASTALLGAAI